MVGSAVGLLVGEPVGAIVGAFVGGEVAFSATGAGVLTTGLAVGDGVSYHGMPDSRSGQASRRPQISCGKALPSQLRKGQSYSPAVSSM